MEIILIIFIVILIQRKEWKVKKNRLWFVPALLLYVTSQSIMNMKSITLWESVIFLSNFSIGLGIGVIRGRVLTFRLDSETGNVLRKGTWLSTIILLSILIAKLFIKQSVFSNSTQYTLNVLTNTFLCMTLGTAISRSYYIWRKYRELTNEI
ncbi:DUF1453 family protein [Bacillus bingmayongensis]|uniref:DUF1453 family protein n=1 Tax=Bacillus bingmayongensis TaxID=1150157 RepID=UPI0003032787|nr:DUF1453 family protein [Bacillus bingmayongensis]